LASALGAGPYGEQVFLLESRLVWRTAVPFVAKPVQRFVELRCAAVAGSLHQSWPSGRRKVSTIEG